MAEFTRSSSRERPNTAAALELFGQIDSVILMTSEEGLTTRNLQHAPRFNAEVMSAASTRYRLFIGASSCLPFPAFTDVADKATATQTQAKTTRHLATSIGVVMPSMLHSAVAADDDDADDDGGGGSGKLSKTDRKKAARELRDTQQAHHDAEKLKSQGGGGGGGGGNGGNAPGDLAARVKDHGASAIFSWPASNGRPASSKTFDVAAVKKELTAAGVKDVSARKLCVPFQFMYALSSTFADDDKRLAYAYRFCTPARSCTRAPPRLQ